MATISLLLLVLITTLLRLTTAFKSVSEITRPPPIDPQFEREMTVLLLQSQIHQPEVYSKAISILETMESAPSCHRLATLTLINSCQSLERSSLTEVQLCEAREEYATKLAMCELEAAKATMSSHCALFIPSSQACRKGQSGGFFKKFQQVEEIRGKLCYPDVTRSQVMSCITALNSKPQWWISYSNALQSFGVVCQASRGAVEKEEIVERFRRAAVVGSDVTEALAESLVRSKVFVASLQKLQAQVLEDFEAEWKRSRETHSHFVLNLHKSVHGMMKSFRQGTDAAVESISQMKADIDSNRRVVKETSLTLQQIRREALAHTEDLEAAHLVLWETVHNNANLIESTLDTVNTEIPAFVRLLQSMITQFQNTTDNMSSRHAELAEQIDRNNEKLQTQHTLIANLHLRSWGNILSFLTAGVTLFFAQWYRKGLEIAIITTLLGVVSLYSFLKALSQTPIISGFIPQPIFILPSMLSFQHIFNDKYTAGFLLTISFVVLVGGLNVGFATYHQVRVVRILHTKRMVPAPPKDRLKNAGTSPQIDTEPHVDPRLQTSIYSQLLAGPDIDLASQLNFRAKSKLGSNLSSSDRFQRAQTVPLRFMRYQA